MDPETEIRKIGSAKMFELIASLEIEDSWKDLMEIIPDLDDTSSVFVNKYNREHIRLIEQASKRSNKEPSAIFLKEWGYAGKNRPKLKHLLHLLVTIGNYRAADYVAEKLLNVAKPERPIDAPVNSFSATEKYQFNAMLSNMLLNTSELNLDGKRRASNSNNLNNDASLQSYDSKNIEDNLRLQSVVSDMIKFSRDVPGTYKRENTPSTRSNNETLPSGANQLSPKTDDNRNDKYGQAEAMQMNINNTSPIVEMQYTQVPVFSSLMQSAENMQSNGNVQSFVMPVSEIFNIPSEQSMESLCEATNDSVSVCQATNAHVQSGSYDVGPQFSDLLASKSSNQSMRSESSSEYARSDYQNNNSPPVSNMFVPHISELMQSISDAVEESKTSQVYERDNWDAINCELSELSATKLNGVTIFTSDQLKMSTLNFNNDPVGLNGRLIGKGQFAGVYLAQGLLDVPVAVKKINTISHLLSQEKLSRQFRNEIVNFSRLKHDNLLKLIGFCFDQECYCLVYEYILGVTLQNRLTDKNNPLEWRRRLDIAYKISSAIAYLHTALELPLVHCDIKSDNILLDANDMPKLCDFGLAKLISNNVSNSTSVIGSTAYMAPEALQGDVSIKSDTYSFGVVLLELLTGLPPTDAEREQVYLVSLVECKCRSSIDLLLDKSAGDWTENCESYADYLFIIAKKCLLDNQNERPLMTFIFKFIEKFITALH